MRAAGYLDHAATSFPKAPGVAQAMARFLDESAGNPSRGGHRLTVAASRVVEQCRDDVARLLGSHPERTLFGSGATFWLNTLLVSVAEPGCSIVTSSLEHNSVMRPLEHLRRTRGIDLIEVPGDSRTGVPSPKEVAAAVRHVAARAVVLTHASNVTGAVLPVEEIARSVAPVPVLVDGAQTAGSFPFHFDSSGLAAFACSGHKGLLGPPGIGLLLLANSFAPQPLMRGGTGSWSESFEMPELLPDLLEAGTPNTVGIAGLGAACRWLSGHGVATAHRHQSELGDRLAAELAGLRGVSIHGRAVDGDRLGTVSFTVRGVDPGEVAACLDREFGVMMRVGLHCAPAAHRRLGTFPHGTLRASCGPFSVDADGAALVAGLRHIVEWADRA